jgi:hypothetical protein
MTTNLKPADELLSVRQKIKELQDREKDLRNGIVSGDFDTHGDFAAVLITKRKAKRFDRKAAEAELGSLSRFDVETESTVVRIEELQNPDAA